MVVGFESGSQKILDNITKGVSVGQYRRFVKDAKKAGLLVHGCFMAGNPGETKDTLKETLDFAKSLDLDTVQFFPLMVYPGTEAYKWAHESGFISVSDFSKWLDGEGLHNCVVNTPDLDAEELVRFCNTARRQFYLRPAYMLKKAFRSLVDSGERERTFRAFKTFSKYIFRQ